MKMFKMLRMVCFLAMAALLVTAPVQADSFYLGGSYSYPIPMLVNNVLTNVGGGSIDPSTLNGNPLKYVYCVDLLTTVTPSATYANSTVNTAGMINGTPVNNAAQVAWLLTAFGVAGQGNQAKALQAAIWAVIDPLVSLDSSAGVPIYSQYTQYLTASANQTGNVGDFYWITPKTGDTVFQGQVTPTPIPAAVWLLGSGLFGLIGIRRRFTS